MNTSRFVRGAACVVLAALVPGCHGKDSATFQLRDGSTVRGRIIRSDRTTVEVEQNGETLDLERNEIVDVTHPGTAEMVRGGVLLGLAALASYGAATCRDDPPPEQDPERTSYVGKIELECSPTLGILAAAAAIPGLVLEIDGSNIYQGSRARYRSASGSRVRQRPRATLPTRPVPPPPAPERETEPGPAEPSEPSRWCELRGCTNDPLRR